jgi:hypothetical protein
MTNPKIQRGRHRRIRKLCACCGSRPASYSSPGGGHSSRADHNLCFRCFKSTLSRLWAWILANQAEPDPQESVMIRALAA